MRKATRSLVVGLSWAALSASGCQCGSESNAVPVAAQGGASPSASVAEAPAVPPPQTRVGATIVVSEAGDQLLIAEEDRKALWSLPLPFSANTKPERHDLSARPAEVLPLKDRVLVTLRDPGALLVLDTSFAEKGRVALPADAWGIAVTADAKTAVVSSAWTHRVSGVDLEGMKVRWTVDVAREPRAIVIPESGDHAYVTHLVGTALTRIDGLAGEAPKTSRVALPAAPARAPSGEEVNASLAYAAVLSPKEDLLFVPRHALGAIGGGESWWGVSTVDVLDTASDAPIAPEREKAYVPTRLTDFVKGDMGGIPIYGAVRDIDGPLGAFPLGAQEPFVQPRAIAYRNNTQTLLIASEGGDEVVEVDAQFLEPAMVPIKRYRVGAGHGKAIGVAKRGGAPSGIVLSRDEKTMFVFCRTTSDVAVVPLVARPDYTHPDDTQYVTLAEEDPLLEGVTKNDPKRRFTEAAVIGRKLFYNAVDHHVSGGMACAGCHPEGRDDAHVWHEVTEVVEGAGRPLFLGGPGLVKYHAAPIDAQFGPPRRDTSDKGRARQTPMLAGRVRMTGPFGWRAESATLVDRIDAGFGLHRWDLRWDEAPVGAGGPAGALASYLVAGMVAPPRLEGPLSAEAERGKKIFESSQAACSTCHSPEEAYSNWTAVKVKVPGHRPAYVDESGDSFKTPSLRFVGGSAPYYHDGSVATLEALVASIGGNMGTTAHLSKDDQRALVAFLETL